MKINEKGISRITGILIAVVVLLVVANATTVYYFYAKKQKTEQSSQVAKENAENIAVTDIDTDKDGLSDEQEKALGTDPSQFDSDGDGYSDGEEVASGYDPLVVQQVIEKTALIDEVDEEIEIDWQKQSTTTLIKFLPQEILGKLLADKTFINDNGLSSDYLAQGYNLVTYLGRVKNGSYKDKDLYLVDATFGMMQNLRYRVIMDDERVVILNNHSDISDYSPFKGLFYENSKIKIKNLETPDEISIPNSALKLIKSESKKYRVYDAGALSLVFKSGSWLVKKDPSGCFLVMAKDNTARYYNLTLNFFDKKDDSTYPVSYPLEIRKLDGKIVKSNYIFEYITGCGSDQCYNYSSGVRKSDLILFGYNKNNEPIYVLKDQNFKTADSQVSILKGIYESYYPGYNSETDQANQKVSYEDFLNDQPVLYWQDPFGDFVEFRKSKYMPAVECGKPVIYLYPQETTDVSVQVAPTGGFTITEPAYNNGWKVKATPDSELYNYADKQTYPYLFWEGHGYNYQMPNAGFVVKKEEVKNFLEKKLAKLGLIQKEYDEFIEFWLPKMQAKPYYFITFVPQNDFDKIAPLSVSPKPDTIIRVFMDFQGLDNFVRVPEQKIVTPIRKGFTVVEWGGALHN
jgi:hypothetical protein